MIKFKNEHEIWDPIHNFIKVSSNERKIIDSMPFQRLRHIHQLAMSYLLYPAATHSRFEHSLGVMELASRVYDVVTKRENINNDIKEVIPLNFFKNEGRNNKWQKNYLENLFY